MGVNKKFTSHGGSVIQERVPPAAPPETVARTPVRIQIIHNPISGRGRRGLYRRVLDGLSVAGVTLTETATGKRGDAARMARDAADAGVELVVAAGGDGTINEVAGGLAGAADAPTLAILPLGTANVLAHEIGLAPDPDRILTTLLSGEMRPVYAGLANGQRFLQMAGVGFDALVVAAVSPGFKRRFGKLAYVIMSLVGLFRHARRSYRVTIEGRTTEASAVIVCKGRHYAGPYILAPDADLTRPDFEICLFRRSGAWNAARYGLALLTGRIARLADVEIVRATALTVTGPPGEPVQGDGDILTTLPVTFAIDPEPVRLAWPVSDRR